ncbi:penicillin-binding protein 1A [Zooshikella harenae]|uniref:Penicillin-binding protein 1A n=1 Tax=Zooshikella harenae TaxID=2827238 RepID=A0ABS5Z6A1_9GAMM|nr:penicillin-binding protein 1A [Zooshikella harenae]MBU2709577.1 penicillin-binding protein 1A [Zooshikella harenae]
MTLIRFFIWTTFLLICGTFLILAGVYLYLSPALPSVESLRDINLQTPLRIYSSDNKLIGEFGEQRRAPIAFEDTPKQMINAFVAAEDNRFFSHNGVDPKGLGRAVAQLLKSGAIQSGGSTITMQVARNFFLSRERVFSRKFNEILLALQIEKELSKGDIIELYMNKIYLGNRAYGIAAAAKVYYGKPIDQLSLAQFAMIAGLPKAPSAYNPIVNPERALERRNWILGRMHFLSFISQDEYDAAVAEPITASYHGLKIELKAPYLAEMVRQDMVERFGSHAYTDGYTVYTTVSSKLQNSAQEAIHLGLLEYEQRHGYRGPEKQLPPTEYDEEAWQKELKQTSTVGNLEPAIVTHVGSDSIDVMMKHGPASVSWEGLKWARRYRNVNSLGSQPKSPAEVVNVGDLIRLFKPSGKDIYELGHIPKVQGALVSLNPTDGAVIAVVGGFDYSHSKFNRAAQAARQVGSNFKPFIYSAGLENGFTAATTINDAPIVMPDANLKVWRPENAGGKFFGPTRLRKALYLSRNLVSIRLLQAMGVDKAINYVTRFGFDEKKLVPNLSLALGAAEFTPMELATGYAALANGGYQVKPYFISRIDHLDETVYQATPYKVCKTCPPSPDPSKVADEAELLLTDDDGSSFYPAQQVMDPRVNYIMYTILQDVIKHGTGRRALALKRSDLGGKTGTTNDQKDAWFSGFNADIATSVWVGFDQPKTLGRREYGGTAALPVWIRFMTEALADKPEHPLPQPDGLVRVRIDPETGMAVAAGTPGAMFEIFLKENAPEYDPSVAMPSINDDALKTEEIF